MRYVIIGYKHLKFANMNTSCSMYILSDMLLKKPILNPRLYLWTNCLISLASPHPEVKWEVVRRNIIIILTDDALDGLVAEYLE